MTGGRLQGKVVVVIGAGSIGPGWGNGKATAVLFVREGVQVLCVDVDERVASETAETVLDEGGEAVACEADASSARVNAVLSGLMMTPMVEGQAPVARLQPGGWIWEGGRGSTKAYNLVINSLIGRDLRRDVSKMQGGLMSSTDPVRVEVAPQGFVADGFELVRERFAANFREQGEVGAAFAAYLDGELVVDLWGGVRDSATGAPWQADTLCVVYSGTKGLTATCMLQLIERGLLELDAPVCSYWPEFAVNGKEGVLVRHVLSHSAGLPGIRRPVDAHDVTDPVEMAAALAEQELFWEPGSRMWYHPVTYGWLCGELLRRVTDRTLGAHLRAEIAEPLGLEMWIGLPEELERRVAVCELSASWRGIAPDGPAGEISDRDLHDIWHNPELFPEDLPWNTRAWHACEMPASNGIATARAMAGHYSVLACGGSRGETKILGPETIELGRTLIAEGVDPGVGEKMRFGAGWAVQGEERTFGPPAEAFGAGGAGGSEHGAWPQERVGFSYVINLMRDDEEDERASSLLSALHRCVHSQ